jgi:hypothetical protein
MKALKRFSVVILALGLMATSGFGYYHYVHYASANAPFVPIQERFDLTALPNNTVTVFVSDAGPATLQPGDTFEAVVSEIQMAAQTWNAVSSSNIRVAFGGLNPVGTPQANPGIEITFGEVPPGLLAYTANTHTSVTTDQNGSLFVPITESTTVIDQGLSGRYSSGEAFFLTVVHELGHTLGLQHTIASSVMSTEVTRATTKSSPLSPDDIAGISLLYPTQNFASLFGSITGTVTIAGNGVGLASVAAISANGPAVTALTNPDGTYRIDGLAPGGYQLYVHPLPPNFQPGFGPADVVLPVDPNGVPIQPGPLFKVQFYPNTTDWQQAVTVPVTAGASTGGINFAVQPAGSLPAYDVTTYGYPGSIAVKPAYLANFYPQNDFVATGAGLIGSNAKPAPGLGLSIIGGLTVQDLRPYTASYLIADLDFSPNAGTGPRHLIFSLNGDLYILPSGVVLVSAAPPSIASVTPGNDPVSGAAIATLTGSGFTPATRVYFDGLAASILSIDTVNGAIVVTPPPGDASYQATVTALNPDGQSSLFLAAPPTYAYAPANPAGIVVAPNALPAGVEAMIDVVGTNTNFVQGNVTLGLGSSDVVVKRVWVLNPNELIATVSINPNAPAGQTEISVVSGFQVITQPLAFQIQPQIPNLPVVNSDLVNPITGQVGVYAGGFVQMAVTNLPASVTSASLTLTVAGSATPVLAIVPGQLFFQMPNLPLGPAVLSLQDAAGDPIQPVVVSIDLPPPGIVAVSTVSNTAINASNSMHPGDIVNVTATNLGAPGAYVAAASVHLNVGGVDHVALQDPQAAGSAYIVQFMLSASVPTGPQIPVYLSVGSLNSSVDLLPIQSN